MRVILLYGYIYVQRCSIYVIFIVCTLFSSQPFTISYVQKMIVYSQDLALVHLNQTITILCQCCLFITTTNFEFDK